MGILIIVGLAVVIGTIFHRMSTMSDADPTGPGFGDINVAVPPGTNVQHMALDGDRMLLHIDGAGGARILVLDLETGATLGTVHLMPAP